mgnify:FL=1
MNLDDLPDDYRDFVKAAFNLSEEDLTKLVSCDQCGKNLTDPESPDPVETVMLSICEKTNQMVEREMMVCEDCYNG